MHPDRTPVAPRRPASKGCPACGTIKPADDFYVSRGRLSSYCKRCQRRVSNDAYRCRRQDAASASGCASSTAPASAPTGPVWRMSTLTGSDALVRPVPPQYDGSLPPTRLSTAPS